MHTFFLELQFHFFNKNLETMRFFGLDINSWDMRIKGEERLLIFIVYIPGNYSETSFAYIRIWPIPTWKNLIFLRSLLITCLITRHWGLVILSSRIHQKLCSCDFKQYLKTRLLVTLTRSSAVKTTTNYNNALRNCLPS